MRRPPPDSREPDLGPLFAPRAAARASDPETSRQAAEEVEARGIASEQRRRCLEEVRRNPGGTAAEIARAVGMERHAPSRRLPELRAAGLVMSGAPRPCQVMGRPAMTWWPVEGSR